MSTIAGMSASAILPGRRARIAVTRRATLRGRKSQMSSLRSPCRRSASTSSSGRPRPARRVPPRRHDPGARETLECAQVDQPGHRGPVHRVVDEHTARCQDPAGLFEDVIQVSGDLECVGVGRARRACRNARALIWRPSMVSGRGESSSICGLIGAPQPAGPAARRCSTWVPGPSAAPGPASRSTLSASTGSPQHEQLTVGVKRPPQARCTRRTGGPPGGVARRSPQAISTSSAGTSSAPASVRW